jgi:hypothetical protein
MDAVDAAAGAHATDDGKKPVALVLSGYLAAVLLPTIGILFALVAVSRPGRWAKKQGVLIIVLCTFLIAFGIALVPMLTDSYFAGKANSELRAVSRASEREDQEAERELQAQEKKVREEGAAIQAHIRQLKARGGR